MMDGEQVDGAAVAPAEDPNPAPAPEPAPEVQPEPVAEAPTALTIQVGDLVDGREVAGVRRTRNGDVMECQVRMSIDGPWVTL